MLSQASGRCASLPSHRAPCVKPTPHQCNTSVHQLTSLQAARLGERCVAPLRHVKHATRDRVVAMSFLREAFKGAKADIDSAGSSLLPRLGRAIRVARILGAELAAIVALAPYGAYAMSVYRRLPSIAQMAMPPSSPSPPSSSPDEHPQHQTSPPNAPPPSDLQQPPPPPLTAPASASMTAPPDLASLLRQLPPGRDGVAVHRQVSYGPAPRNVLDIYVPLPPPLPAPTSAAHPADGSPAEPEAAHLFQPYSAQLRPYPYTQPDEEPSPAYAPQPQQQQSSQQPQALLPVVFFVHGGVWASGETWQYAPMATRLAQAGLVVVVPTYTLYPEALAGTMVEEVSAALSWTFDNVRQYGGDPDRITAAGHSAGGHLVAMVLLRRAAAAEAAAASAAGAVEALVPAAQPPPPPLREQLEHQKDHQQRPACHEHDEHGEHRHGEHHHHQHQQEQQPQGSAAHGGDRRDTAAYLLGGAGPSLPGALHALRAVADAQLHPTPGVDTSYDGSSEDVDGDGAGGNAAAAAAAAAAPAHAEVDTRMPRVFVGMSAVYDIAKHYEFEKSRAVNELSMMKRAVGGPAGFAAASPTVILAAAAADAAANGNNRRNGNGNGGAESHAATSSYYDSFELSGDAITARAGLAGAVGGHNSNGSSSSSSSNGGGSRGVSEPMHLQPQGPMGGFSLAAARRLPPFVVMGSCADHMVPWHEGAELVAQLRRCSVPVRHLLYNHIGHGDFVMPWRPLDFRRLPAAQQLPEERPKSGTGAAGDEETGSNGYGCGNGNGVTDMNRGFEGLLPCARDFLLLALGRVRPVAGQQLPLRGVQTELPGRSGKTAAGEESGNGDGVRGADESGVQALRSRL